MTFSIYIIYNSQLFKSFERGVLKFIFAFCRCKMMGNVFLKNSYVKFREIKKNSFYRRYKGGPLVCLTRDVQKYFL